MKFKISSIILAAGMSKRMKLGNKLLLKVNNEPILQKVELEESLFVRLFNWIKGK